MLYIHHACAIVGNSDLQRILIMFVDFYFDSLMYVAAATALTTSIHHPPHCPQVLSQFDTGHHRLVEVVLERLVSYYSDPTRVS